jgi:hypothetical protein
MRRVLGRLMGALRSVWGPNEKSGFAVGQEQSGRVAMGPAVEAGFPGFC